MKHDPPSERKVRGRLYRAISVQWSKNPRFEKSSAAEHGGVVDLFPQFGVAGIQKLKGIKLRRNFAPAKFDWGKFGSRKNSLL